MGRKRSTGNKPYKIRQHKDRPIDVEFDIMPGKRISTGYYTIPQAIDFAENYLKTESFTILNPKEPTLHQFSKNFFMRRDKDSIWETDRLFGRYYDESRYQHCQAYLDNYILPKFGNYLVTAITASMIERWLPYIQSVQKKTLLSNDCRNKILNVFRIVMDRVKKENWRDDNPAADVVQLKRSGKEREALSPQALMLLFPPDSEQRIKIWESLMWATYFSIMYDTGFRPGELAALRVCDIWQTKKGLAVSTNRSVNRLQRKIINKVKTTGHGYSERVGLLYDDTATLLIQYIDKEKLTETDMLFRAPKRKDGLIMPETSNKHFKTVLMKHGLYHEGIVQYCLRHNYTTDRRGDMPDELLAISMGHTHLRDDYDHQKAQDLIRRLDVARDGFFEFRKRQDKMPEIIRITDILDKKKS